jgi:hypothetical protein
LRAEGIRERAYFPVVNDLSGISFVDATDDLDDRGLAGAVLAHKGMHFASAHGKANMVNCLDAFECLIEIPNLKNVLFHLVLVSIPGVWPMGRDNSWAAFPPSVAQVEVRFLAKGSGPRSDLCLRED